MCLIICTVAFFVSYFLYRKHMTLMLHAMSVMFGSASLMWIVDCLFAASEGEGFFDLSLDDTLLGLTIVVSGVFAAFVIEKLSPQTAKA